MPESLHTAEQYVEDVLSGKILAGEYIIQACQRHKDDIATGHERGIVHDPESAQHAIDFFQFLHHSKGEWAGEVFELSPWQEFILWSLFGWKREDGLRRFRTAYVEVPRKNGKSTFASGIGLYMFFADGEPGAEVYTAATKRDQARITHGEAERMVKASPMLKSRIGIVRDNLHVVDTASKFMPLGADADTMDGLNVHGAILVEVHAMKNRLVVDVMETATGARRQPLIFEITTAGHDRLSVCWEHHDYVIKILEGSLQDDTFFGYIAAIDEDDDWTDPAVWAKANPNWGISAKADDIERKATKAKEIITAQNNFLRLHLNVWTEQETRWLDMLKWNECPTNSSLAILRGKRCFVGLDLSTKIDMTAAAFLVPPAESKGIWHLLMKYYMPKDNIRDRVNRDRIPYDAWVQQGYVSATPGNVIDYNYIRQDIAKMAEELNIHEIGFDPWNATQTGVQLQEDGFQVVEMRQGHKTMAEPTKELEALVKSARLDHGGCPVLRWMASNVVVREDSNLNFMPDKSKSSEKIDGIVALLMALGRAIITIESESVYSTQGIMMVG